MRPLPFITEPGGIIFEPDGFTMLLIRDTWIVPLPPGFQPEYQWLWMDWSYAQFLLESTA